MNIAPFVHRFRLKDLGGCSLWVNGDAASLDGSNNNQSWTDQSGSNHPLLQAGAPTARPSRVLNAINGKTSYSFDGANDFMQATFTLGKTNTIFIVYKSTVVGGIGGQDTIFDGLNGFSNAFGSDTTPRSWIYNGTLLVSALVANLTYAVVTVQFNGASSFIRANGVQLVTGNPNNALSPNGFTIGASGGGTRAAAVEVAEAGVFNRLLTVSEVSRGERGLAAKFKL